MELKTKVKGVSPPAIVLTIAGSDSGGGAGIQADLKTFARFGVYGTSAITAVTAQNTMGVTTWEAVSPSLVRAQIEAVLGDLPPRAMKTGMLGSAAVGRAVVETLRAHGAGSTSDDAAHRASRVPLVVDPVMVSTSGALLLEADAVRVVREELLPLTTLVTPNLDEVRVLLEMEVESEEEMCRAAERIVRELGARAALVKGGHGRGDDVVDVLYDGAWHVVRHPRIATRSTHGTGCTLSAAVTAGLAMGRELREAVDDALEYVQRAIETAPGIGGGAGPLNHWA